MDWIKVTPDTMPPDMETVIVTILQSNGEKIVCPFARYIAQNKEWYWAFNDEFYSGVSGDWIITHWMPYLTPAED